MPYIYAIPQFLEVLLDVQCYILKINILFPARTSMPASISWFLFFVFLFMPRVKTKIKNNKNILLTLDLSLSDEDLLVH